MFKLFLSIVHIFALILIKIGDGVLFALKTPLFVVKLITKIPPPAIHFKKRKPRKTNTIVAFRLLTLRSKIKYFFFGFLFSLFFICAPLIMVLYINDLPNPQELKFQQVPQTTKIYDRNGILLHQIYANQNRTVVPLSDIPKKLQEATIAIEDKDFYNHPGFDASAIIRAAIADIRGMKTLQGGSTITQQLIKTDLLTSERTFGRKIKEVVLAFLAERIYSKDEILTMYFNHVPYGGTAWGVETASELYFNKSVKELNLAESAFLAGLPEAPTTYSPYGENPTLWKKRQKEVLRRMQQLGYVSEAERETAEKEGLVFVPKRTPLRAPHFVMYVRDLLIKKYGINAVERGGLSITTTLDLKMQDTAQKIVSEEIQSNTNLNLTNGAALITDPRNGDILAMIGSADFDNQNSGNVNLTTSLRQPGSSIKPVTYSAALMKGYTAATGIDDSPVSFPSVSGPYSPVNYDGKFHGRVSLRNALGNSLNIPAVRTLNSIGVTTMVNLAQNMGIKTWGNPSRYGLPLTLGSVEVRMTDMATVYGVFANSGDRVDLNPILKATDYKGNVLEEKIAYSKPKSEITGEEIIKRRVLDPRVTFIISDILADNQARTLEFGSDSALHIPGKRVPVKTGTTDNKRDNWTIGYIPNRVVVVWVGNNNNSPMDQALASGITGAAPIWNKIMKQLLTTESDFKINPPVNIIQKPCNGRIEYFIKGSENSVYCSANLSPTPTPTPKSEK